MYVRTGLFDAVLVRPLGALPQLLLMDMPLRKVARGAVRPRRARRRAARWPTSHWTPARVALLVVAPLGRRRVLRGRLRGHRHRGVLVDRVRRDRQRASPTAGATSRRTRSRSTAAGSGDVFAYGARLRVRGLLPGAGAARPRRPARRCRRWVGWVAPAGRAAGRRRRRRSSGAPASGTTGARGHDASSRHAGCARSSPYGCRPGRLRREKRVVAAVDGVDLRRRARRDARLHRPERRRQVDDAEDAHRRAAPRPRARCGSAAWRRCRSARRLARRIGVVFGQRSQLWWDLPLRDSFDAAAAHLPGAGRRPRRPAAPLPRAARPRRVPRHAGAAALARPADARRADRRAAARAGGAVPRRADDRARRGEQAGGARRSSAELGADGRHHARAHHARPGRHRAAVPAAGRHRPRPGGARRHDRGAARPVRLAPPGGRRPRRAAAVAAVTLPGAALRVDRGGRAPARRTRWTRRPPARWSRGWPGSPRCATCPCVEPDIEDVVARSVHRVGRDTDAPSRAPRSVPGASAV